MWADHRDQNFGKRWAEYYRMWRGEWSPEDKTRGSERSRIIAPALQQAIEATVAELEEASFGRGRWIEVEDDLRDDDETNAGEMTKQLIEDFDMDGVPDAIAEVYLNGALYGTGIAKIVVSTKQELVTLVGAQQGQLLSIDRVAVSIIPIEPYNFVIDPAARTIDEALGVAHITLEPHSQITKKQASGEYKKGSVGTFSGQSHNFLRFDMNTMPDPATAVKITEWHGLVPKRLLT